MEQAAVVAGFVDDAAGARLAMGFVQRQRFRHRAGTGQRPGQDCAVLHGDGCALGHVGQHRMGGIADERGARGAPSLEMRVHVQWPAVTGVAVGGLDDRQDIRMPAVEIGLQFGPGPPLGPGFLDLFLQFHSADEVEQAAAAQEINHRMLAGPDPDRGFGVEEPRRQPLDRHGQAPRRIAGILRPVFAGDLAPHCRFDAVGADQDIACDFRPIGEHEGYAIAVFPEAGGGGVQADAAGVQRLDPRGQDGVVVGPVELEIGRAMPVLMGRGERQRLQDFAIVEQAEFRDRRQEGRLLQRVQNAQMTHDMGRVGALLDAGADLAQFRGLFVNFDLVPGEQQAAGRRQPGDPGACDQDSGHADAPPNSTLNLCIAPRE